MKRLTPLAAALLLAACARHDAPAEEIRAVRTVVVAPDAARGSAAYSGEIKARRETALAFQTGGRIAKRLVEVGDAVAAGQPLMMLDPTDASLSAAAAKAELDSARARQAQDRSDLERFEALAAKGFVGRRDLDKARLALDTSAQTLKAAEAQYKVSANQAGYTTLRATTAGVVTAIDAEIGRVVQAGTVVVHVAEKGERELVVSVPESRVDELRDAKALRVALWANPDRTYEGKLRELAPDTDTVTRTYAARISIVDADAATRLGMTARLTLELGADASTRKLPLTALYDVDGHPKVWVVDAKTSRVKSRAIDVAALRKDAVLVRGGLVDGERVVTAGVHVLHDGQQVRAVDPSDSKLAER